MTEQVKWKVFKEKVPPAMSPMWVVWDEYGEFLFRTGQEALLFVNAELKRRSLARKVKVDP